MSKFRLRRLGVADDPGQQKPTLQACLDVVLEQSDTLMDDVIGGLRGSLTVLKGKTAPAVTVPAERVTVAGLLSRETEFKRIFAAQLRASLYGGDAARQVAQPLVRFDDFQFLEAEQIDANIEFALTQQEVMLSVEDTLPVLNAMVSNLLGWTSVQAHMNPLKPESFVYALRESMRKLVPDEAERTPVMALTAARFGVSLRYLYIEVSDWLRAMGVEPVLVPVVTGNLARGTVQPAAPTTSMTRTLLTLDKLRRLLSGELGSAAQVPATNDFMNTVPASFDALQDMQMVELMMKRLADRAARNEAAAASRAPAAVAGAAPAVAARQAQLLEDAGRKTLGAQLGEEVVHMMLDNLTQDTRLLSSVRDKLKELEPVLMRLSASDPRFFSDRQHPARVFLDRMTHRSLAYKVERDAGFERYFKSLANAVTVLRNGAGDATAFARLLRKLEARWAKEEAVQRQHREEAARVLLHAEQRNLLAHKLAGEFRERMVNKNVPELVQHFLYGPWSQVVAQAQLQYADGTVDPCGYQNLVDDLIWSVQLRLVRRNRARLVQLVPGMLVTMRQGLELISYPAERTAAFFNDLVTIHEQAFDTARNTGNMPLEPLVESPVQPVSANEDALGLAPHDAGASEVTAVSEGGHSEGDEPETLQEWASSEIPSGALDEDDVWMVHSEASDSGYLDDGDTVSPQGAESDANAPQQANWDVDGLKPGAWVNLALGGEWVRAQLTWASPHRTLFMFVSGGGLAHSMSRRTLKRLHAEALIQLVSDGRVMDNALDGVAQAALRNAVQGTRE